MFMCITFFKRRKSCRSHVVRIGYCYKHVFYWEHGEDDPNAGTEETVLSDLLLDKLFFRCPFNVFLQGKSTLRRYLMRLCSFAITNHKGSDVYVSSKIVMQHCSLSR